MWGISSKVVHLGFFYLILFLTQIANGFGWNNEDKHCIKENSPFILRSDLNDLTPECILM